MEPVEGPAVSQSSCLLKSYCELWGMGGGVKKQTKLTHSPDVTSKSHSWRNHCLCPWVGDAGNEKGVSRWRGLEEGTNQCNGKSSRKKAKNHTSFGSYFKIDSANTEHNTWCSLLIEIYPAKLLPADGLRQAWTESQCHFPWIVDLWAQLL